MTTYRSLFRIGISRAAFAVAAIGMFFVFTASAKTPSMMWRISKGGKTAYLLGSIHIGDKSLYPLPTEIESAFDSSDHLLVELDLDAANIAKVGALMQSEGMYPAGDNLWKHVNEPTAVRLKAALAKYKIPEQVAGLLRPWVLALQLTNAVAMQGGADPGLGIDKYFLDKARGKKTIEQVETPEFQLDIFARQPEDVQIKFLVSTVDEMERSKTQLADLEKFWIAGDADGLDRFTRKSDSTGPLALSRQLREDRNPHMADKLTACMDAGNRCFMVVGTAHLIGKDGIVDILKQRGYKAEQVQVTRDAKQGSSKQP